VPQPAVGGDRQRRLRKSARPSERASRRHVGSAQW
jgi:hypothetical protein